MEILNKHNLVRLKTKSWRVVPRDGLLRRDWNQQFLRFGGQLEEVFVETPFQKVTCRQEQRFSVLKDCFL